MTSWERTFARYRKGIAGINARTKTLYGTKPLVYADWSATGRVYLPIEKEMLETYAPYIGNTHTSASTTGKFMSEQYAEAKRVIKRHVGARDTDALLACGSGMTGAVVALQDILQLRVPADMRSAIPHASRPVVFVTHMEHHSNHTTWLETVCDVEVIKPDVSGLPSLAHVEELLEQYRSRPLRIAAITAASNVTGALVDVHAIARIMHENDGLCFVDYTAAAPYLPIDMHPRDSVASLDAIYFSPHKFLGGAGTPGILVFDAQLYASQTPQRPGGGTVRWTDPWGGRRYIDDIEVREDGGTPPFWGVIKASLAIQLKDKMTVRAIGRRERELNTMLLLSLKSIPGLNVLAPGIKNRLPIVSLTIDGLHYELVSRLLNDRFGIQSRSGCMCAGTYGHYLLGISRDESQAFCARIDCGDESLRPGFVRLSLHPTTTDAEVAHIIRALAETAQHGAEWAKEYAYDSATNEHHRRPLSKIKRTQKTIKKSPQKKSSK